MTSEKANSVKLTFGKNNLAITANAQEVGEARKSIAINHCLFRRQGRPSLSHSLR
jgi:DNA polymerase III sliding clamp (beta) subunit (PCNA family)